MSSPSVPVRDLCALHLALVTSFNTFIIHYTFMTILSYHWQQSFPKASGFDQGDERWPSSQKMWSTTVWKEKLWWLIVGLFFCFFGSRMILWKLPWMFVSHHQQLLTSIPTTIVNVIVISAGIKQMCWDASNPTLFRLFHIKAFMAVQELELVQGNNFNWLSGRWGYNK